MRKYDIWLRLLLLQVDTLIMMYKTHCQCILDNAINVNFEEVSIMKMARQTHQVSLLLILIFNFEMFLCFSDPEFFAAFLAGDARPPVAAAGEPCHCGHLLRL